MKRLGRAVLFTAMLVGAGVFVWREVAPPSPTERGAGPAAERREARSGRRGTWREEGPVPVLAATARVEDVPVTLDAVGTAQALNTVVVRSQVEGRLIELAFREGQEVKRGDVLARIDPTVYQAQYDQAVARKAQNEANLANVRLDLQRYEVLAAKEIGSRKQADTQRALVAQLEAQLKFDQGAIDNAKAVLDYTVIRAPIDGRLGLRLIDQGNLVRAGDGTGLVVITQIRPISIVFNLPQQSLRAVNQAMAGTGAPIEALDGDGRTALDSGRLEVVDNQVDQSTGTVKLKAIFPNPEMQLWPGAFVNVRLTVDTLREAVVVPTAALQRGPTGPFVYVIEDDKAVLRPVTVGRQTEAITVVSAGLAASERVVTTGFGRLTNGARVTVSEPEGSAEQGRAGPQARSPDGPRRGRAAAAGEGGGAAQARPDGRAAEGRAGRSREGRSPADAQGQASPGARSRAGAGPAGERPAGTGSTRP